MQSNEIRQKFLKFFEKRGHKIIPSSSLIPENDQSVLFTTAGMQQFKPYYLGEPSPYGNRVASSQKCVRTSDIEEVGDESHLTFFEMLGNFSFGGYWKKEAIEFAHELITRQFNLKIDYVSIFTGENNVPEDTESANIWKSIDPNLTIKKFGRPDNFWGPTGDEGPCGPTTEIYVDGIEVWNIVFNEFYQDKVGNLEPLKTRGVDTGMGLERLVKVMQKVPSVFETDLFIPLMKVTDSRIAADHIRTSVFIIADGVRPSNTDRGYILRRLLRRAYVKDKNVEPIIEVVLKHPSYAGVYTFSPETAQVINTEIDKFKKALDAGLKQVEKGSDPFTLFTSYGLPLEIIKEVVPNIDEEKFRKQMEDHQQLSRTSSSQKFKN